MSENEVSSGCKRKEASVEPKDTYRKRAGTCSAGGHFLEINLLTLFKLQGDKRLKDFYLAGNLESAADFDDVVFRYVDSSNRRNVVFLQSKWKERTSHKVTLEKFQPNGEWPLQKYFTSYLKIQDEFDKCNNDDPIFRDESESLNRMFVIYTNAIMDENIRAHVDEMENNPLRLILEENCGHAFKLKPGPAKEIFQAAQRDSEIELLKKLLKQIANENCQNLYRDENFKLYRSFFTQTVLVKNGNYWEFRIEFLEGDFENESITIFRDAVLRWYVDKSKSSNIEINIDEIKMRLKGWKLKLPDWFGKTEAKFDKEWCDEFIDIVSRCTTDNICTITRMSKNLLKIVAAFVGNVFVFDEGKAMFKFNKEKLAGEPGKVLDYLSCNLNVLQIHFDFQIENFPRLCLGFLRIHSKVGEFISNLTILTGQPDERSIENKIKGNFRNLSDGEVMRRYLHLKDKITAWWTQSGHAKYLRKGDGFFDGILSGIIFNLIRPLKSFTGRIEELKKLHAALQNNDGGDHVVVISQMASISGLGGVGKSELARQYAGTYGDCYDGNVIWVDAETHDSMADCFCRLCRDCLNISTQNADKMEKALSSIVQEAYNFFQDRRSLFIFDNAKDFKNGNDGNSGIQGFLPILQKGITSPHFLITSRSQSWPSAVKIALDVFTDVEAEHLVKCSLGINDDQQDNDMKDLLNQLNNFPLALQQAVAYIVQTDKGYQKTLGEPFRICDYLRLYAEKARQMLDFKFPSDSLDQYTKTTFMTWNITLEEIEKLELGKEAREIFNMMAYLNPNDIPVAFFKGVVQDCDDKLVQMFNLIEQYSMITLHDGMVNIHRVVQNVSRLMLQDSGKQHHVLKDTLSVVQNHTDNNLIIQGASVWNYASNDYEFVNAFNTIPAKIILALNLTLKYDEASAFGEVCLKSLRSLLGFDHTGTLSAQLQLAVVMSKQGKYNCAAEHFQEVFAIQKTMLGHDHPDTLSTQHNIAQILSKLGKYEDALCSYKEVLEKETKILGPFHPTILTTEHNIAHTLSNQGKYKAALNCYEKVFEKEKETLGCDHPSTLTTQHNIAFTLSNQGKYEEALCSYKEVFEKVTQIFGPDHPDTLTIECNIARTLASHGKDIDAFKTYNRVLKKISKILGPYHPFALDTRNNITEILSNHGKYEEALEAYREVSEKYNNMLGPSHPSTLSSEHNIAHTLSKLSGYEEALAIYNAVFEKRAALLGPDHPDALTTRHNIAEMLSNVGRCEEALRVNAEVFEKRAKILGPDHPDTLTTEHIRAKTLFNMGRYDEALGSFKDVFEKRMRVLGPDLPDTVSTQLNIARTLFHQGKYEEALCSYKKVLEKFNENLVSGHPSILCLEQDIAHTMSKLGKREG